MAFGLTRRKAALLLFYGAPVLMFLSWLFGTVFSDFFLQFWHEPHYWHELKKNIDMSPTRVTRILGSTVGTLCPNKWKPQIRNGAGTGALQKT